EPESFGQRNRRLEATVKVALGHMGDSHELVVEFPALLGDGDHLERRTGEERRTSRQAFPKSFAFLDHVNRFGDCVDQDLVADRTTGDSEAINEWNSCSEQGAQHPCEACHGILSHQSADRWDLKHYPFPRASPRR